MFERGSRRSMVERSSRQVSSASRPVRGPGRFFFRADVGGDVLPDPGRPGHVEDAARVDEVVAGGEGHGRDHGLEVRRRLHRGQPLHRARVGEAERADDAVGPGLRGRPLDRVVAVASFVDGRARTRRPTRSGRARPGPPPRNPAPPPPGSSCSPRPRACGRRACGRRGSGGAPRPRADRRPPAGQRRRACVRARRGRPRRRAAGRRRRGSCLDTAVRGVRPIIRYRASHRPDRVTVRTGCRQHSSGPDGKAVASRLLLLPRIRVREDSSRPHRVTACDTGSGR